MKPTKLEIISDWLTIAVVLGTLLIGSLATIYAFGAALVAAGK